MKRYKFHKLALEITRRCNKKCEHCMRGEAQNVTMTHEMVDKIIDDVEDVTRLVLFSGEVLLEIDTIDYLIQKVISSHWTTRYIELTTNGTVCDKRIIDLFESFCIRSDGNYVVIRVSNDQFHNPEEYKKAYAFYEKLVSEANERIQAINVNSEIILKYVLIEGSKVQSLEYIGNAKNIIDKGNDFKHGLFDTSYPNKYGHRIKIVDGVIPCTLQICANGNVSYEESLDYITLDEISFGNILQDNLAEIIDKHNDTCMVLCSETDVLNRVDYEIYYTDWGNSIVPLSLKLRRILYDRIIELRQLAKEQYPFVPAAEIITKIQFPNKNEELLIYKQLHSSCQCASYGGKMAFFMTEDDPNFNKAMECFLLESLFGVEHEPGRKQPYYLFGDLSDKLRWLEAQNFDILQNLASKHLLVNNRKNFYCNETDDNTISYEEDTRKLTEPDLEKFIAYNMGNTKPEDSPLIQRLCKENGLTLEELKDAVQTAFAELESTERKKLEDFANRYKIS